MLMLFDGDLDKEDLKDLNIFPGKTKKKLKKLSLNQSSKANMPTLCDEVKKEEMNEVNGLEILKKHNMIKSNKRKYEDDETSTSYLGTKKKKLNSRLKRLLKSKNKKAAVSQDTKLSPFDSEKEMKLKKFQNNGKPKQTPISESDDSGVESFNSDLIGSKDHQQCENSDMPSNLTLQKYFSKNHIHSQSSLDKTKTPQGNDKICDICFKTVSYSCTCTSITKASFNKQQTSLTIASKKEKHSLSIVKNSSYLGITYHYTIPLPEQIVAMDCEFVGVHPKDTSALGRCSVVDFYGNIIYDTYVRPETPITHYRTRWSGIRKRDMKNAVPFREAQNRLKIILQGKIVVGHALFNDFKVIKIRHLGRHIRDTSGYKPLRGLANLSERTSASLKNLTKSLLGKQIQEKEHCSVEDCRAAMDLYKMVRDEWEQSLLKKALKRQADNRADDSSKNRLNEIADVHCNSKTFFSDEFWPQYLFPSSDHDQA